MWDRTLLRVEAVSEMVEQAGLTAAKKSDIVNRLD
jgi:hypothetical protein